LYAFSYLPFYFVKKMRLQWVNGFFKLICSGIFLKVFFLICFIPFYLNLSYLLMWQIVLTVADFFSNSKFGKRIV